MNKTVFLNIYLDTRRAKSDGTYPVKLRVYTSIPKMQKLYPTKFSFTEERFKAIFETVKTRREHLEDKMTLQKVLHEATEIAEKINPFTFEAFETLISSQKSASNLEFCYFQLIDRLKSLESISTASLYELSYKSLQAFYTYKTGKVTGLNFNHINDFFLKEYEKYMIDLQHKSYTTVSIYLRNLRTVFNHAIHNGMIEKETYPFGKRKYQMPQAVKTKKVFSTENLKKLIESPTRTMEQERGKDFWLLSFNCNGINIKDLALLRNKDYSNEKIEFYRKKTVSTNRNAMKKVEVFVNTKAAELIEKYRNTDRRPDAYLFTIIGEKDDAETRHKKVRNFIHGINQGIKRWAKEIGLDEDISTYWARHTFATTIIRNGGTIEFVSEALSHSNIKTTQAYFAGFEDKHKKELMNTLMDV